MTIDEAINKLEHGIEQLTVELKSGLWEVGSDTENAIKEGIKDNEQLIAWLIESKEAKRLLKVAIEDFNKSLGAMYTCPYCKYVKRKREVCASRKEQYCGDICEWRYADEALKLIGED